MRAGECSSCLLLPYKEPRPPASTLKKPTKGKRRNSKYSYFQSRFYFLQTDVCIFRVGTPYALFRLMLRLGIKSFFSMNSSKGFLSTILCQRIGINSRMPKERFNEVLATENRIFVTFPTFFP